MGLGCLTEQPETRYVRFLRGINVGGHRKIPMQDLRASIAALTGDPAPCSYIASGNVVFDAKGAKGAIQTQLEDGITETFGFDVPVLLRTADEITQIAATCPFPDAKGKHVLAYLCFDAPTLDRAAIAGVQTASEHLQVVGRTVWLHAPDGIGRSRLVAQIERYIGVGATARNFNTIRKMAEMVVTLDGS